MSDNAAKITGTLESAMAHLRAAENDLIHANVLIRSYATGTEEHNIRDIEGAITLAKKALRPEIEQWSAVVEAQEK